MDSVAKRGWKVKEETVIVRILMVFCGHGRKPTIDALQNNGFLELDWRNRRPGSRP